MKYLNTENLSLKTIVITALFSVLSKRKISETVRHRIALGHTNTHTVLQKGTNMHMALYLHMATFLTFHLIYIS